MRLGTPRKLLMTPLKRTIGWRAALSALLIAVAVAAPARAAVNVEKITYMGFPNSYRLSNGTVELVVTTDVGPRILRYGFVGGENVLGEVPEGVTRTELGEWHVRGGHRLWYAPEAMPRTYVPDNDPVPFMIEGGSIRLTQNAEKATGIQKEMLVTLAPDGTQVEVRHRITNRGFWPVELAPWALTVVRAGGETIIPQEAYALHGNETLLPVRSLVLWSYSDLGDPRFTFGRKFLRVRSDPGKTVAIKVGVSNTLGWVAYATKSELFVKRFPFLRDASYPDRGCNMETYTEGGFMEIETVAPLGVLQPGATFEHVERWYLFKGVDVGTTDASIEAALAPRIAQTMGF